MKTWWPDAEQSARDTEELASRTLASLAALCRQRSIFGWEAYQERSQLATGAAALLHPLLFEWYFALIRGMGAEAVESLPSLTSRIESSVARATASAPDVGARVDLPPPPDGWQTLARASRRTAEGTGSTTNITFRQPLTAWHLGQLRRAFDLIRNTWPEAHQEVEAFVRQLYVMADSWIESFADFHSHGAIFVREDLLDEPVRLAEQILHESAHVRLNSVMSVTPLLLNGHEERFSSPLRSDLRPMAGVLHQMFVLRRTSHFHGLLTGAGKGVPEEAQRQREMFAEAMETVTRHGLLTDAGRVLMGSVRQGPPVATPGDGAAPA